jgi:hypothetical protein
MRKIVMVWVFVSVGLGCEIEFPNGIKVGYEKVGEIVQFDFGVPEEVYLKYSWVGFGMKYFDEGTSMVHGDYYIMYVESGKIEDCYGGERNGPPKKDEKVGGTEDILNTDVAVRENGVLHFMWDRKMDTGDKNDVKFVDGGEYFAQWAVGMVSNGFAKHHNEAGSQRIFFGECDNSGVFIQAL